MESRQFDSTNYQIPVIGQGTWYIDAGDRALAIAALRRGIDLDMNHIDTAEMCGDAEEIVGHGSFPGPDTPGGRVLQEIAAAHDATPRQVALRFLEIVSYNAIASVRQFERLGRAVDEAELEVPISDAYELADAAKSHERLAEGHVLGKIVLMVRNATTLS
jgi:diketogulonate reductase-like aldo/keto reductase